ncbi:divalent cation tolerance protein [Halovenus aranensis]|jgi:periplasmic divalent cation tolerance protein|uniref:Divalent cation tolerance protein n=1 Tax=Halovenus aranensis TaxID=890420 RepID=A0A1G8XTP7_9EURY|nr:divalent cation tolerance protein CutA [Halovenus aranensis]SDJ93275.1 divalent cation tolerance protein [Halovenus aranensis]
MPSLAVSAGLPTEADATELSRTLVEERLAAGTRIVPGTSHYRWEGTVHERRYWTVHAFTTAANLAAIYDLVEAISDDDLPGVTYNEIDASDEYLDWIDAQTV